MSSVTPIDMSRMMSFIALFLFIVSVASDHPAPLPKKTECHCSVKEHCDPVTTWNQDEKEVFVASNGSKDFKKWMWDTITTVISISDATERDLMCYAHSKGKKYGCKSSTISEVYRNETTLAKHISDTLEIIKLNFADVIVIDLLELLGNCSNAGHHVPQITEIVTGVIKGLKAALPNLRVICEMPWKPPCYDNNCEVGPALSKVCDAVQFSLESFSTYCDEACIAKATAPFSKIMIGIVEYVAVGFNHSQLIISIPWHGYKYTCDSTISVGHQGSHYICYLKKATTPNTTVEFCDYKGSRERVSLAPVFHEHPSLVYTQHQYSRPDQAPWMYGMKTIQINATLNQTLETMMWYEDIGSLEAKYELIEKFGLKGCMIYTGEDLLYSKVGTDDTFNTHMWSWMLHTVLVSGERSVEHTELNYAGTIAGVGVGMFLFGCLLGLIISCLIFRRKKKLRPPFQHDRLDDEFHDDDNVL